MGQNLDEATQRAMSFEDYFSVRCIMKLLFTSNTPYLNYTANTYSKITVKTQVKTVRMNYSFFTVTWTSICHT